MNKQTDLCSRAWHCLWFDSRAIPHSTILRHSSHRLFKCELYNRSWYLKSIKEVRTSSISSSYFFGSFDWSRDNHVTCRQLPTNNALLMRRREKKVVLLRAMLCLCAVCSLCWRSTVNNYYNCTCLFARQCSTYFAFEFCKSVQLSLKH